MNDEAKAVPFSTAVVPTWSLTTVQHPKKPSGYVRHEATDIRKTFAKHRAAITAAARATEETT